MTNENLNLKILKPFGPPVGIAKIPESLVNEINNYVDNLEKEKIQELDSGSKLAGNVSKEFDLEKNFVKDKWLPFLAKTTEAYINNISKKKITNFNLIATWLVKQYKHEYNPIHWHTGDISGVGYLKVPKIKKEFIQKNKDHSKNADGNLILSHGSKQFLSNPILPITPEIGKFVIFPNYMMHTVYPFFNSNEERRSISFNAKIETED